MKDYEELEINSMWDLFPEIKEDLKRCKYFLLKSIDVPNEEVKKQLTDLINGNGKLIRPALMIIFGKIFGEGKALSDDFIRMAASMEYLHMTTLIHDDIIDDSDLRRGKRTLQNSVGKDVAVYSGDYMLSSFYINILKYGKSIENSLLISECINEILAGELIQMENRNNYNIKEEDYFRIIRGKTAIMIALSCYEGAYLVGAKNNQLKLAWDFGENIGLSYQIIDDLIDCNPSEKYSQKPTNRDFIEGNFTLPFIKAFDSEKDRLKYIRENFCNEDIIIETKNILNKTGALEYSNNKAQEYSNKIKKIYDEIPKSVYKDYLIKIIKLLLNRMS